MIEIYLLSTDTHVYVRIHSVSYTLMYVCKRKVLRKQHIRLNEVRASQLAQASERVGSPIPASQQGCENLADVLTRCS